MWTHRTKVHVAPNQTVQVALPGDAPEGEAEVIVVVTEPSGGALHAFPTVREFDAWLERRGPGAYTAEEIDRHIEEERAAWD